MKNAYLAIEDRRFYLTPEHADEVAAAAREARERGDWLDFHDVTGGRIRLLVPHDALVVLHEYDVDDTPVPGDSDLNDWRDLDYDI
ncbi:hypothetical protein ACFOYW_04695 [Gryllotalpicola reticulitermitis]|uniref:Uncharacterized protein n=1 Tax=Gryllotalpicola reticulitermitis TaxID=1184153 RepID=A0ABV8Q5Q6_9MICO